MSENNVRWGKEAEQFLKERIDTFKANMRRISIRLAKHERAETIDRRHVENCYEGLIRCGLDRTPWWERPQLKVTASAGFVGIALAMPDFAPHMSFGSVAVQEVIFWSGVSISLAMAVALYVWSWLQNRI